MPEAVVRSGINASAVQWQPSKNYATSSVVYLRATAGSTAYGYVYFAIKVPRYAKIVSATLRLYGRNPWGAAAVPVAVQRLGAKFTASRLTWNNKPGVTGPIANLSQINATDAMIWAFDVTAAVQQIANGSANYGWRIAGGNDSILSFYAFKAADHHPQLQIEWLNPPDPPTTLSPDGNLMVSLAQPVLDFDYQDHSSAVHLAAVQVQIDHANSFTAPDFDSGIVNTIDSQLDLTDTTYPGLAIGASTYWRVRVMDSAGVWSGWSHVARFQRKAKMSVTLDNPAPAPNNFVSESTPEIFWRVGGAGLTQTHWRVFVQDDDDHSVNLWDSGTRSGTDDSVTLPSRILRQVGTNYRVGLRIYDDQPRVATVGDPAYVQILRVFTYNEDPTIDAPTVLDISQDWLDRPWASLYITRPTAPDRFTIFRDGKVIRSNLDPADLDYSPTHYRYIDKDATANRYHTWSVQAVVNHKSSPRRSTTFRLISRAVWLTDTDYDKLVAIVNVETAEFAMPDTSVAYEPIGLDHVVRITQAQRGLQGTISGLVTDYAGGQGGDYRDALLWMKQHPARHYRLTLGQESISVLLGNVLIAPSEFPDDSRTVSFDFWSTSGVRV